jgi:hypothetical protein
MDIQLKIDDREVKDLLHRLRDRAQNLTPTMQAIGLFYERRVIENFKAESAPDGTSWKPLSEVTYCLKSVCYLTLM